MTGPIFIGGMYRSGTSLLRAMLGQHPDLFSGFETGWCVPGNFENAERWLKLLSGLFDAPLDYLIQLHSESSCAEEFLNRFMVERCRRAGKKCWIEKTPLNGGNICRILDYWPDAKIIHIFREPMDVYASVVSSGKWTSPEEFSLRWCSTCGAAIRTTMSGQCKPGSVHTLAYEALVESPDRETRTICRHIDAPWTQAVAVFEGTEYESEKIKEVLGRPSSTAERMREPLNKGRIGASRELTDEQKQTYQLAVDQIFQRGFRQEFEFVRASYVQERSGVTADVQ